MQIVNQILWLMELPDFMSYSDKFSSKGFVEKISRIAKRAGSKLVYSSLILYYTLQSKDVSLKDKAMVVGALGYLISPLDVMPDAIPIVGLTDDLAVLGYVINKIWGQVPPSVMEKAKNKLSTWFDEDEMQEVEEFLAEKERQNAESAQQEVKEVQDNKVEADQQQEKDSKKKSEKKSNLDKSKKQAKKPAKSKKK